MSDGFLGSPNYQSNHGELVNALESAIHIYSKDKDNDNSNHTQNNIADKSQYPFKLILYLRPGVDGTEINEVVQTTLEQLNITHLDKIIISLLFEDTNFENFVRPIWKRLETLKDEKKVNHLGVYNFSQSQLQNLLRFAKYAPIVDYIPLKNLNEIKGDFLNWAKEKNINLLSYGNSDQKTLFEPTTLSNIFKHYSISDKEYKLNWALRYSAEIEDRKIIVNFGYIFKCEIEAN